MIKTFALLLDAYRELNARRLFWVVLGLSGLVVVIFGIVGIRDESITILNWESPIRFFYLSLLSRGTFYKLLFVTLGIQYWLSWLAVILALVSTAGMFPDFLAGGSIELYLSKPISRLRLFTTKYFGGLLFVAIQVTVFCVASFLVLGFRGGTWEPSLFLAVPLVVLMFSYLFAVCVLLGVLTRSTVAALLLTLLFWFVLWAVHSTEVVLLNSRRLRISGRWCDWINRSPTPRPNWLKQRPSRRRERPTIQTDHGGSAGSDLFPRRRTTRLKRDWRAFGRRGKMRRIDSCCLMK